MIFADAPAKEPKLNPATRRLRCPWARKLALFAGLVGIAAGTANVRAEQVTVAVAANFRAAMESLEPTFAETTGHDLVIVSGSTGQLYAQIVNGAPFDVLLAADHERPEKLASEGRGIPETLFTYAIGRLALWSADEDRIGPDSLSHLGEADFRWLAIAEPELAPYGRAAREVLEGLGIWETMQSRLVRGQNVAQAFAMVETGNADLGLVALSQALAYDRPASYLAVPATAHATIRQDAIVLVGARNNPAAFALLEFLQAPESARIIEQFGYAVASLY